MRIDFHSAATRDIEESRDWYAEKSLTAVRGFERALDDALIKIAADPERFPKVGTRFRTCSLLRFPFQVVFQSDSDRVFIIAVAHAKRIAGYWNKRDEE